MKNPKKDSILPDVDLQTRLSCDHCFVFIRQETGQEHGARYGDYVTVDVFYCSKCLEYRQKEVRRVRA